MKFSDAASLWEGFLERRYKNDAEIASTAAILTTLLDSRPDPDGALFDDGVPFDEGEPADDPRFQYNARSGSPLTIHLTLHSLGHVVRQLLPFYGGNCPVSVIYGRNRTQCNIVQGTLDLIEDPAGAPSDNVPSVMVIG